MKEKGQGFSKDFSFWPQHILSSEHLSERETHHRHTLMAPGYSPSHPVSSRSLETLLPWCQLEFASEEFAKEKKNLDFA